jgi:hypothetical protein
MDDRQCGFLLLYIASLGGPHISRPLLQNGLFYHVDSGGTKGIAKPGPMGDTGKVKRILGETLDTVFGRRGSAETCASRNDVKEPEIPSS